MKKLTLISASALASIVLFSFGANAASQGVDCRVPDNIIHPQCQMADIKAALLASPIYKAATTEAMARLTPSEMETDNGTKILTPAQCADTRVQYRSKDISVTGRTDCTIQLKYDGQAQPVVLKIQISLHATLRGEFEMYHPEIATLRISEATPLK